jgi:cytidine deaminase
VQQAIDWAALREAALEVGRRAYVPYSHFHVGAAALTADGRVIAGCNVENASYGLTLCAETTAIGAMITAGDRDIAEVLVLTERAEPCPPCGRCRQQLAEFARPGTPVHLCGPEGLRLTTTLGELLPLAFGPGAFERPEP